MSTATLSKITAPVAAAVCAHFELEPQSLPLLNESLGSEQFLRLLIEQKHYVDAVGFLAHALPKREAVWWACVCARTALGAAPAAEELKSLSLAEAWVIEPSEANRRAAMTAAEASEFKTSASWAAVAAFWSGGSMAPADLPEVPPAENLTGKAVAAAVMIAVGVGEPDKMEDRYRQLLARGLDVARGGNGSVA
jgi:hypothetical protein